MNKIAFDTELKKIVEIGRKYGAKRIILFGSCLEDMAAARDIDIAVSGIPPGRFFDFYADVSMNIPDEADIIDLDDLDAHLRRRIETKGKFLYEREF